MPTQIQPFKWFSSRDSNQSAVPNDAHLYGTEDVARKEDKSLAGSGFFFLFFDDAWAAAASRCWKVGFCCGCSWLSLPAAAPEAAAASVTRRDVR